MSPKDKVIVWSAVVALGAAGCSSRERSWPDAGGSDGTAAVDAPVDRSADAATPDVARGGDSAVDSGADGAGGCTTGVDSDGDDLDDWQECVFGTDPHNPDTDGDGLADGVEVAYPAVCVGPPASQRRPPVRCADTMDCATGEMCRGLDPLARDTDGDTLPDGAEDRNADGRIDSAAGETDPRLLDTDGDGFDDATTGTAICRTDGLASVSREPLPAGLAQLGFDPAWGQGTVVTGTSGRGALVLDDATAGVAGAAFELVNSSADAHTESTSVEAAIASALGPGVSAVLVGQSLTTHDLQPAVTSTYRVEHAGTSASALRDALMAPMVGAPAPARSVTAGAADEFLLDVTTVVRTAVDGGRRTVALVAIAPRAAEEDATQVTAIRVRDLVNTTALADADRLLDAACDGFTATPGPPIDFLWTVDTSGSMQEQQDKLGRVAARFFDRLRAANVDFRVGVFDAGAGDLNLDRPGFQWIDGADPTGAEQMCDQVTDAQCPISITDTLSPYPVTGGVMLDVESPVGAAVTVHYTLAQRTRAGETNPDRRLSGGRVVAFFVTDEPTTDIATDANDWTNYFSRTVDPQADLPWGGMIYSAAALGNIVAYFQRNAIQTFGMVPAYASRPCSLADARDLPHCVIEANGGAFIPIGSATDAEVSAAFERIVDAVAGGTSQFALRRSPITSTLRVRVRNTDVPRSRSDGFDYDPASRAIVIYGAQYRPHQGDPVVVSYRVWGGTLG